MQQLGLERGSVSTLGTTEREGLLASNKALPSFETLKNGESRDQVLGLALYALRCQCFAHANHSGSLRARQAGLRIAQPLHKMV